MTPRGGLLGRSSGPVSNGPLFDPVPIARTTDADSSHEAAAAITQSGARGQHALEALAAVRLAPGETSAEIAAQPGMSLDVQQVRKRLSDLMQTTPLAMIHQGAIRKCRVSGRRQLTWWPGPTP